MNYAELIARLPLPTLEQTAAFAEHVAENHSWYKHLPCFPPGASFVFLLNPHAGEAVARTDTGFTTIELEHGDYFRHHSRLSTLEYRTRFGHWDYWVTDNPRVPNRSADIWLYGVGPEGREPFPTELAHQWACRFTAFLLSGPLLRGEQFERERAEFEVYAQQHADDRDVPRYRDLGGIIGTIEAPGRNGDAFTAFRTAEVATQQQLVLQTVLMVREHCANMRAAGA
jgi:hypothetical protein